MLMKYWVIHRGFIFIISSFEIQNLLPSFRNENMTVSSKIISDYSIWFCFIFCSIDSYFFYTYIICFLLVLLFGFASATFYSPEKGETSTSLNRSFMAYLVIWLPLSIVLGSFSTIGFNYRPWYSSIMSFSSTFIGLYTSIDSP